MPYPLPLTRTEAYLAYKAGVIQQSDLKPSLAVPRNGIDAWLAYWTGLAEDYPKREDGTPHILQEEEAYIAYLCGVLDEYPEKCLRRVGAYLRYIISARWGRPDHPLNREELYLSLIETQFIPSGDPSSDIVIDGTAKAPFVDVKMYGDTFQQSYEGHNILPNNLQSQTINGVTFTRNDDGSISIRGTATARTEPRIWQSKDGGSLVFENGQTYFNTTDRVLYYYAGGYYTLLANASVTMPATRACGYVYFRVENGETIDTTIYPQIIEGPTVKAYEPYVGGQPSPNPDYPQPIQTVTGTQTVEIVGKNLYNPAQAFADGANLQNIRLKISIEQGQTYTFNVTDNHPYAAVRLLDSNDSQLRLIGNGPSSHRISFTAQGEEVAAFLDFYSGTTNVDVATYDFSGVQLEKGSSATSFIPYSKQTLPLDLGSIELCKLGSYQDYIWKDGDDWKVHKATKTITASSSDFSSTSSSGGFRRAAIVLEGMADSSSASRRVGSAITNLFHASTTDGPSVQFQTFASMVVYANSTAQTYQELMDSIDESGMIVTYAISTPTDTIITDTNLIAQLEALVNGGSEEGTTYIRVSATDPNLPALLYVEAPKYD